MTKVENNELTNYLSEGIQIIIRDVIKNSIKNPKEAAFLLKYYNCSKKSEKIRKNFESEGKHIPAFLISSITRSCNLHCVGCYARSNGICHDETVENMLSCDEWENIFKQASNLGIAFNLLAGGEPLLRYDVIEMAAKFKNIVFPIFTNGTMIDEKYIALFDNNRNLVPVLSLEGDENITDDRRGTGVYELVSHKMKILNEKGILYGTSITVTNENMCDVVLSSFINELRNKGCRIVFFIEYVPVSENSNHLAFEENERIKFEEKVMMLKEEITDVLFVSFPGDEKMMGGCLAAGRGFFHINPHGGAEACPFSPYSDCSLKEKTLIEAIQSPFFKELQMKNFVGGEHTGGCALFEREQEVLAIINNFNKR